MIGERYSRLIVIDLVELSNGKQQAKCLCDCGMSCVVGPWKLKNNRKKSCGCLGKEMLGKTAITHGKAGTPIYRIWLKMIRRCGNPKDKSYESYGARGITVCKRWLESFENFLADMGERPSSVHSIDRRDNDGNYEPGNCKWATRKEQARNRRSNRIVQFRGRSMLMIDAANLSGINYGLFRSRLQKGWTVARALAQPVVPKRRAA